MIKFIEIGEVRLIVDYELGIELLWFMIKDIGIGMIEE